MHLDEFEQQFVLLPLRQRGEPRGQAGPVGRRIATRLGRGGDQIFVDPQELGEARERRRERVEPRRERRLDLVLVRLSLY